MIVAIDGPAGAGKSTIAKILAQRLGFLYIDTGAMYRALTLKVLEIKLDINDIPRIIQTAQQTKIVLINNPDGAFTVLLDGRDVSGAIREPRISRFVSDISKIREVRQIMVNLQRNLGNSRDSVLDGRDIGTVVFPKAEKKFYLDGSSQERVRRRYVELKGLGQNVTQEAVAEDLFNRDLIDSTREIAPLKKADDAMYIDTTNFSIEEVADKLLKEING